MSTINEIINSILSSIDIIVDKKIKEAQFNSTVVGVITAVNHPFYQVKYQDLSWKVQSIAEVYAVGDVVFILIP